MLVLACALCLAVGSGDDSSVGTGVPSSPAMAIAANETEAASGARQDGPPTDAGVTPAAPEGLLFPGEERHLRNIRQLTVGHSPEYAQLPYPANYAEAYWSPDGKKLILQSTRDQYECDQMFVYDLA